MRDDAFPLTTLSHTLTHPLPHITSLSFLSLIPVFSSLSSSASGVGESSLRDDVSNTAKNEKQLPVDAATGFMSRGSCCCWIVVVVIVVFSSSLFSLFSLFFCLHVCPYYCLYNVPIAMSSTLVYSRINRFGRR